MKKVLNILGYISLLVIPYLVLLFYIFLFSILKIIVLIVLIIIIVFHLLYCKKKKIKYIGITILMIILEIVVLSLIIHLSYGIIKNIQAKKMIETIDRIEFTNQVISQEELKGKLEFVNSKEIFCKGAQHILIYYIDGTVEESHWCYPSAMKIKNNYYYYEIK